MTSRTPPARIGFLLTQLGSEAARRFGARTKDLGITPSQAGVIRILGRQPGISQRDLADKLGAVQSRVVALIDSLEALGYVVRVRSATDRRSHELRLTDHGQAILARLRSVAEAHEAEITRGLTSDQRETLAQLLGVLRAASHLDPEVHPGYAENENENDNGSPGENKA